MKKKNKNSVKYCPSYPNAANPRYFLNKTLDALTAIASGMGFLTVLLFIFLL